MAKKQEWLSKLKNKLSSSPLVSNVVFGFILLGLEKHVELEFECPCDPKWNTVFSSAFFVIPAVMAFTLMVIMQGSEWRAAVSSCVPAIVWLTLLFFDGLYFACAKTDWEGSFVLLDKAVPHKWCEPTITMTEDAWKQVIQRSQGFFVTSQVIGMSLLMVMCVGLIMYMIVQCHRREGSQNNESHEMS
ncbi:hypothetical protein AGOR_G00163690 [Albula goreensis]|uniref:Uncharacterized protein n=1 Tax=Albula goreensis TaxID=1534307 RepID=A0A8T3D1G1_9TELE|nr:hypothetical protein AGOR_G00163690 [Albula goreensis]